MMVGATAAFALLGIAARRSGFPVVLFVDDARIWGGVHDRNSTEVGALLPRK